MTAATTAPMIRLHTESSPRHDHGWPRLGGATRCASVARSASAALAAAALALAGPAAGDATGLSFHSTSTVIDGQRYFVADVFVDCTEPCDRVLLFHNIGLSAINFDGTYFQETHAEGTPSMLPMVASQGTWAVDTHICIGGNTQADTAGLSMVTPDWNWAFGQSTFFQPGCYFNVPPTFGVSFAGDDLRIRVARIAIHESHYQSECGVQFSGRFATMGTGGYESPSFQNFSLLVPFQLTPTGSTADAHDTPAGDGVCFTAQSGGGGGGGGSTGSPSDPPPGVANANPPSFDFNGDGDFDLMWYGLGNGMTSRWTMNGIARSGGGAFPWSTLPSFVPIGAADAGDDGSPEVFFYNQLARWVQMWSFIGDQRTATTLLFTEDSGWTPCAVGDFTGDGRADVLSRSANGLVYRMRPINQTTVYAPRTFTTLTQALEYVTHADLDGDGRQDLVLRASNGIYWGRRVSATGFTFMSPIAPSAVGSEWRLAGTGDFDGDHDDDVLWHNTATGEVRGWTLQNGVRVAGAQVRTGVGSMYRVVATLDTDHDGDDDIVWRNEATGDVYAWRMQGMVRVEGGFVRNVATYWTVVNR